MTPDDPIAELVALLGRLPGIGERTATRLAHHVLAGEPGYAVALAESLGHIHERVQRCDHCGNFCAGPTCAICRDPKRDEAILCVVARVPGVVGVENRLAVLPSVVGP